METAMDSCVPEFFHITSTLRNVAMCLLLILDKRKIRLGSFKLQDVHTKFDKNIYQFIPNLLSENVAT
jgi:hypothetical protein